MLASAALTQLSSAVVGSLFGFPLKVSRGELYSSFRGLPFPSLCDVARVAGVPRQETSHFCAVIVSPLLGLPPGSRYVGVPCFGVPFWVPCFGCFWVPCFGIPFWVPFLTPFMNSLFRNMQAYSVQICWHAAFLTPLVLCWQLMRLFPLFHRLSLLTFPIYIHILTERAPWAPS